jgi:uncharacterized membrane protein YfcA
MKLGKDEVGIIGLLGLILIPLSALIGSVLGNRYITWIIVIVLLALGFFMYYYDARKHRKNKVSSAS